jgi:acyl-CoA synthetase (AMP-forming)/AMP-acid ligase II
MENLANIAKTISDLPDLKLIIPIDYGQTTAEINLPAEIRLISYPHVIKNVSPGYLQVRCIDIDLVSLIYTSGSSGNPKGVMLTHQNMISAADSIIQYLENTRDDIIMDALPLAFDYGLYQILMSFRFGGTVILEKGFTYPQQIIDLVIGEKVTGWPLVPTMAAILIRLRNLSKLDFSNLRYITTTGQLFPPKHILQIRKLFPKAKFFSMYGLTECKRVSYLDPEKLDGRLNSVGKPMPNIEAYIVDSKGREITDAHKPGELVVRGSNIMRGYWNLPQDTDKVLRPSIHSGEKVLYTGDMFERDDEGYLYFLSRKDDIIKTAGFMVSPKEIENVLYEMEDIVGAAVIGVDDSILGKAIKAFVQLRDASNTTEEDILSFCSECLEQYSVPKYIKICQKLPLTETGKISKRKLG